MNIEICNYTKKLSKNLVLENINLSLSGGKIYGFVGKNGSGKTMLMRAICGLILPTSGFVKINNKIIGKDISFPDSVGALIENPGFISEYSGFQNLKILAQIQKKIDDKKIVDTMRMVGLDPNEKKSFRKYSLGMKQKLGIAAAMMETMTTEAMTTEAMTMEVMIMTMLMREATAVIMTQMNPAVLTGIINNELKNCNCSQVIFCEQLQEFYK